MRQLYDLADEHVAMASTARASDFVRSLIARAAAGSPELAAAYARQRWGTGSRVVELVTRAAVPATSTSAPGTVSDDGVAAAAFFAQAASGSILGRLSGTIRVPPQRRVLVATGATAHWTGQGSMKPLSPIAFSAAYLEPCKVVALTVATQELLNDPSAEAEASIRTALTLAVTEAIDEAFVDPSNAGIVDVKPASVTNGVTPVGATAVPGDDLRNLVAAFAGDLASAFFIMGPIEAVSLVDETNPNISVNGGTLMGVPTIVSRNVPQGVVALVAASAIVVAEGEASGRVSTEGAVLMADTGTMSAGGLGSPDAPVAAQLVSLFQTNTVALVVERVVSWHVARPGAVAVITGAAWGA